MLVPPVLNFAMLKVCTTFLQRVYTLYDLAVGESRSRILERADDEWYSCHDSGDLRQFGREEPLTHSIYT
jgi:hypothetical protein